MLYKSAFKFQTNGFPLRQHWNDDCNEQIGSNTLKRQTNGFPPRQRGNDGFNDSCNNGHNEAIGLFTLCLH